MAIHETLTLEQLDTYTLTDADLVSVSEAFARLAAFVSSDTERVGFKCDAATLAAFRIAACRIVGLTPDRETQYRTVKRTNSAGKSVAKRLRKDESPRKGENVSEHTQRTFSGKAQREGVRTLRESQGVAIKRHALGEGLMVVSLSRNTEDAGEDA